MTGLLRYEFLGHCLLLCPASLHLLHLRVPLSSSRSNSLCNPVLLGRPLGQFHSAFWYQKWTCLRWPVRWIGNGPECELPHTQICCIGVNTQTRIGIGSYLTMDHHRNSRRQPCPGFLDTMPPCVGVTCCTMSPSHQIGRQLPFAWLAMPSYRYTNTSMLSRLLPAV